MVYLLFGTKDYKINEYIKNICKNTDKLNISKYDLNQDNLINIIEDCETMSLFQDKKIIIVENANIFTGSSSKDSDVIEKYLNNINPYTILILIVHNEKIDSRKKITKLVKENGQVIEFNSEENYETLIKNMLKDYNIDYKNIKLFLDRVGKNPLIIENEINKIKLYKDNSDITSKDIINLTSKTLETDIFKLINKIVLNDKEKTMELYHDLLKNGEEPLKIIIILANQFRIIYQSKTLLSKGFSEKDIANILKIHPYRVKLAIQNSRLYDSKTLLDYIYELADIDLKIKKGLIDKNLALELFLLQ